MAKSKREELADHLHAQGLRKRVARALAEAADAPDGARSRSQQAAGDLLARLREVTEDLERRIGTPQARRREAAEKAAQTRQRDAQKRSAAAKKAAQTRASRAKTGS